MGEPEHPDKPTVQEHPQCLAALLRQGHEVEAHTMTLRADDAPVSPDDAHTSSRLLGRSGLLIRLL